MLPFVRELVAVTLSVAPLTSSPRHAPRQTQKINSEVACAK